MTILLNGIWISDLSVFGIDTDQIKLKQKSLWIYVILWPWISCFTLVFYFLLGDSTTKPGDSPPHSCCFWQRLSPKHFVMVLNCSLSWPVWPPCASALHRLCGFPRAACCFPHLDFGASVVLCTSFSCLSLAKAMFGGEPPPCPRWCAVLCLSLRGVWSFDLWEWTEKFI